MRLKFLTATLVLAVTFVAQSVRAQEIVQWGTAGGWDILIDKTLNNGCFMQAEFQDGSLVRMGIDKEAGGGYVTAFNDAWGDIEDGGEYDISFDLDGELYNGEAKGIYLAGAPGADISFDSDDFFWDLMRKNVMTLIHDGEEVMTISLEGTYVGLEAVLQWVVSQDVV